MTPAERERIYNDRRWKIIRKAALVRDGYQCQLHLPGCLGRATTGDHVVALEDGGPPFALSNTQAACKPCNSAKENHARRARTAAASHAPSRTW